MSDTPPDRLAGPLLRPAPGVIELLHGSSVDLGLVGVPPALDPLVGELPAGVDAEYVERLGRAFADGSVDVVGIWGAGRAGADALVAARRRPAAPGPLRRLQRRARRRLRAALPRRQ